MIEPRTAVRSWSIAMAALIAVLFVGPAPVLATEEAQAGAFLMLPVSAREAALAQTAVVIDSEATAFHWNPGGLGEVRSTDVSASYTALYDNLASHQTLAAAVPIGYQLVVGAAWVRVGVDDIPIYPSISAYPLKDREILAQHYSGTPDGMMSFTHSAYVLSIARSNDFTLNLGWQYLPLPVSMPVGVSAKYISIAAGDSASGTGIGYDAGARLAFNLGRALDNQSLGTFRLGVTVQNIGGTKITWDTPQPPDDPDYADEMERMTHWGMAYEQPLPAFQSRVTGALTYTPWGTAWGIEYTFRDLASLRAGRDVIEDNSLSFGAGFGLAGVRADYSIQWHPLGVSHRVSLHYRY